MIINGISSHKLLYITSPLYECYHFKFCLNNKFVFQPSFTEHMIILNKKQVLELIEECDKLYKNYFEDIDYNSEKFCSYKKFIYR